MEIESPFTVQKYIRRHSRRRSQAGYDVLIMDSLSHVWAGDGGLLDQKSAKDSRGGSGFSNWADISKVYEQFKTALLQSPLHIIGTMRSKQDYVIEQGGNGKQTPRKVGLAPIQREGFEYEFTTVFDVDMSHTAATSKDRTGLFTDEIRQITEEHGRRLADWLAGGAAPASRPLPAQEEDRQEEREQEEGEDTRVTRDGTLRAERAPADQRSAADQRTPACTDCGKALTKAQGELSARNYGKPLCLAASATGQNTRRQGARRMQRGRQSRRKTRSKRSGGTKRTGLSA